MDQLHRHPLPHLGKIREPLQIKRRLILVILILFVAFHEPAESGLNGHVWVYDTQDGALLRKYDNVCYQPVKIMYKKK